LITNFFSKPLPLYDGSTDNFLLQIYDHLNRFDGSCEKESDKHPVSQLKMDNDERAARTLEDMQEEAKSLSQHFQD
jgi:hypothetical protein